MKRRFLPLLLVVLASAAGRHAAVDPDVARWEARARHVTITRDDWGIPHIHGQTDADAVFGMVYAQAEDDFRRVELNYINATGRLAEAEGETEIYRDLRMKMFIDPEEMRVLYSESPAWLRDLMDAFADGLNYYLHTHPEVEPLVIQRFEPWMALTFTEGSIGGDIERISLRGLEAFYGSDPVEWLGSGPTIAPVAVEPALLPEPTGSNGFAISPSISASGNALLLINPHTSFYFRAENQVTSDEGLNAYGATTWGQFFVYQGFNDRLGWMHTSTGADAIDEYAETIVERDGALFYVYGDEERPVTVEEITVPYRDGDTTAERVFTVYRTHHGPIVRETDGRWIAVKLMEEPIGALTQSYMRTKARDIDDYIETMRLHTNSSNNTVYADADGSIAYFHANFIPRRDDRFDWRQPVDGSDPDTEWRGLHTFEEAVNVVDPPNGWVQNTNNWPYSAAGEHSPRIEEYPSYMDMFGENMRGLNAQRVLNRKSGWTLDKLQAAAYDTYLTGFEPLIPSLVEAYDALRDDDPRRETLAEPIDLLRAWDLRYGVGSIPTSLAVFWGDAMVARVRERARAAGASGLAFYDFMANDTTPEERIDAFAATVQRLTNDFGSWATPWGEINRFQRLTGDIVQPFDDEAPSLPVAFTSSRWGSLAAYGQRTFNDTKRIYGTRGNTFVAVVEFGDRVRARAITAGGQSGDPASPHFDDQALRFTQGDLRPVYFYPDELEGYIEEAYHPGER